MDPTLSVNCPDCAHPLVLSEFTPWGEADLKSIACGECGSAVTYPTAPDGSVDISRAPIGRGVHGTTREAREAEVLVSRPALEQPTS